MPHTDNDFKEAIDIINNLIDGISFLPQSWDNMLMFDIAENVKRFMEKHDPENWGTNREKPKVTTRK